MSINRTTDHGLIFEGDVKIRNRNQPDAGVYDVGNTTSLTTATSTETKERISKRKGTYGQALDSLVTQNPTEVGLTLDTFDKDSLAMALMGEAAVIQAKAETITDTVIVIGKKGAGYKLPHENIDPATIRVKNKSDQPVAPENVKFNANVGLIEIAAGTDNVQDGDEVKVSYKTRAAGGFKIAAGALSRLDLEIWVDGKNRITGESGVLHIPHAVLAADGDIDWFGDDFAEAAFKGTAVLASGETSTYYFSSFNN